MYSLTGGYFGGACTVEESQIGDFKMKALKFQFWHTIVVTIPLGLTIILFPKSASKMFKLKEQDQVIFGVSGSVWLAFGLLSILGVREPLKWSPILMLQFAYKVIWFTCVLGLMAKRGEFELESAMPLMLGFAPFVAADLVAVPWEYLLGHHNG
jgi:hypothetical protein